MPNYEITERFRSLERQTDWESDVKLEESIRTHGCVVPVVVWSECRTLIDGHRRHDICVKLGIEPPVAEKSFLDEDEAAAWAVSQQTHRRNLTPEEIRQRVSAAAERIPQSVSVPDTHPTGYRVAAREAGVSTRAVKRSVAKQRLAALVGEEVADGLNRDQIADINRVAKKLGIPAEGLQGIARRVLDGELADEAAAAEAIPDVREEDRLALVVDKMVKVLDDTSKTLRDLSATAGLEVVLTEPVMGRVLESLKDARRILSQATPTMHDRCRGVGCDHCDGRGWMSKSQNKMTSGGV